MDNINIGYTPNYVDAINGAIIEDLIKIKNYIQTSWDGELVELLRFHWVGEDEQHYEQKLVEKINFLYQQTLQASKQIINTIADLGEAWQTFQLNNTINGETIQTIKYEFDRDLSLNEDLKPIFFKPKSFRITDARGLRSADSGQQIKFSIDRFVADLRTKCITLFNEVDPKIGFYGEQTKAIKLYIESAGKALAELLTAIKDMYEAIDNLVIKNYFFLSSSVSETMTSKANNSDSIIDPYASQETRWM